ncbi:MAG TPA: hypothetical protein VKA44_08280, partial [Gemmatimonadota bacterium]|nr:hypothetical protein [Gemmatimonadota bacterium]
MATRTSAPDAAAPDSAAAHLPAGARPAPEESFESVYPASRKVYVEGSRGVRVPVREVSLSDGRDPVRLYDTSGPQGRDPREGLPRTREAWVRERGDVEEVPRSGDVPPDQRARVPGAIRRERVL